MNWFFFLLTDLILAEKFHHFYIQKHTLQIFVHCWEQTKICFCLIFIINSWLNYTCLHIHSSILIKSWNWFWKKIAYWSVYVKACTNKSLNIISYFNSYTYTGWGNWYPKSTQDFKSPFFSELNEIIIKVQHSRFHILTTCIWYKKAESCN